MTVDQLAQELLSEFLSLDPINASMIGIEGYESALPAFDEAAERASSERLDGLLDRSKTDTATTESEQQTLDFISQTATNYRDALLVPSLEWTIGDFHGAPVASLLTSLPELATDTPTRVEGYLERLHAIPSLLREAAHRHREGVARHHPGVRRLIGAAIAQLEVILDSPDLSGIARPDLGSEDTNARQARLIAEEVRPALVHYQQCLRDELLESGRNDEHVGLCFIEDGLEYYSSFMRLHTSTLRSARELHETGLQIIAQVSDEFRAVGLRLWGLSDLGEIFARMREAPELRYRSEEDVIETARAAVRRAEKSAPQWFVNVPDEPCLVQAVPAAQQAGSAPAYYIPGALDGSRQGTFYINASQPTERFRHMAEAVAFHEAVPGHHFQITLGMQNTALPLARRVIRDTASSEGWGLYAERLGEEMGLYSDDVARLGMLAADAWRAGRLVVDTGMHALGWSRQQAVSWMTEFTPLAPLEIESEINRYITYPGQALSYMVGRLELMRLREHAAGSLDSRFDLRAFHDFVLHVGALPLGALSSATERWIAAQQQGAR
jgi:uncharacterized protein (DUF885 family)